MSHSRISRARAPDLAAMGHAIDEFLTAAGFDMQGDEHIERTGERVAEAWANDLLDGYKLSPAEALGQPFPEQSQDMVVVHDIEFSSSCPHHLMPYQGRAHVAYVPKGTAVGFSGIVRLIDCLAHRLTLQEWLSKDLCLTLEEVLQPLGAGCIIQATPTCVFARGVRRSCRVSSTSFTGIFAAQADLRRDLFWASGVKEQ